MKISRTNRLDHIVSMDVKENPWDVWGTEELRRHTWWVATNDNGRRVGFAGSRMCDSGRTVYLAWAVVLPTARGAGLQKRFIRVRCAHARKAGATVALTYTAHDNIASMRSLIACGFKPYEPAHAYVGKGWVYWWKDLT